MIDTDRMEETRVNHQSSVSAQILFFDFMGLSGTMAFLKGDDIMIPRMKFPTSGSSLATQQDAKVIGEYRLVNSSRDG